MFKFPDGVVGLELDISIFPPILTNPLSSPPIITFPVFLSIVADDIVPDEPIETIMCQSILKSGKNKGEICGKNCKIGFNVCQRHFKIKDEI